jgi:HEAT repeat protein
MPKMTRREQLRLKYRYDRYQEERTERGEIDDLLEQTCDPDPKVRNEAARHLCPCHVQMNVPVVWDRILEMVNDPDPKVRGTVLHTLADGSPREREAQIVTAIESMYHDPDPKLRRRVRKLLAQYRQTGKINVL